MKKELLIIGGTSTALEIYEAVQMGKKSKYGVITFVIGDHEKVNTNFNTIKDSELNSYVLGKDASYIISLTNHKLRIKLVETMEAVGLKPVNVVHPLAMISPTAKLGLGIYVAAGTKISANTTLGNHCILNYNTVIGHDAVLDEHVIINPGVRVSGNVHVGTRVLIGANSVVYQGKRIGADVMVDAMTYVKHNINNGMICSNSAQLKVLKRVI